MRKKLLTLLICIISFMLILSACAETEVKVEENNFIDEILQQPNSNTTYWYVVSSDAYILRKDIKELVDILSVETWENTSKAEKDEESEYIVINFNEFPKGKNAQNFDYGLGTIAVSQLRIGTETQVAFNGYSNKGKMYLLSSDIVNAVSNFINEKAVSYEELVEIMN